MWFVYFLYSIDQRIGCYIWFDVNLKCVQPTKHWKYVLPKVSKYRNSRKHWLWKSDVTYVIEIQPTEQTVLHSQHPHGPGKHGNTREFKIIIISLISSPKKVMEMNRIIKKPLKSHKKVFCHYVFFLIMLSIASVFVSAVSIIWFLTFLI